MVIAFNSVKVNRHINKANIKMTLIFPIIEPVAMLPNRIANKLFHIEMLFKSVVRII